MKKILAVIGVCFLIFFSLLAFVLWSCGDIVSLIEVVEVTYDAEDIAAQQEFFNIGRLSGGESYRPYIWFYIDSDIPADSVVSAELRLTPKEHGQDIPIEACAVIWDYEAAAYTEVETASVEKVQSTSNWYAYDVTRAVKAMLSNYGNAIMLKARDERAEEMITFLSTGTEYSPVLSVRYKRR